MPRIFTRVCKEGPWRGEMAPNQSLDFIYMKYTNIDITQTEHITIW